MKPQLWYVMTRCGCVCFVLMLWVGGWACTFTRLLFLAPNSQWLGLLAAPSCLRLCHRSPGYGESSILNRVLCRILRRAKPTAAEW